MRRVRILSVPYRADAQTAGAYMGSDTHREWEIDEFQIREGVLELVFKLLKSFFVHHRVC